MRGEGIGVVSEEWKENALESVSMRAQSRRQRDNLPGKIKIGSQVVRIRIAGRFAMQNLLTNCH